MEMVKLDGTTAAMVESIRFTKAKGECEFGRNHDRYAIEWTDVQGAHEKHIYWCPHPFCNDDPWMFASHRPAVKLTAWLRSSGITVANAYILLYTTVENGVVKATTQARVGICSQWRDPQAGNCTDDARALFTQRYFAESGPGVYPAEIHVIGVDTLSDR